MNTATFPPWLAPWSTGLVYGQRVFKSSADHYRPLERSRHRSRLTIYTYGHENTPILSWSDTGDSGSGIVHPEGVSNQPPLPGLHWERVPLEHDNNPWRVDVPVPVLEPPGYRPGKYDPSLYDDGRSLGGDQDEVTSLHAWGGALRGWAAGATLLALLVVLARAFERYLDWRFMRSRRMQRNWQRPNVRATSRDPDGLFPPDPSECSVDLPPAYSECTSEAAAMPKPSTTIEEPPPPYSDSCVQLINKNGVPVIIYSRSNQNRNQDGGIEQINQDVEIPLEDTGDGDVGRIQEAGNTGDLTEGNTTTAMIENVPAETIQIDELPFMPPPDEFTDSDETTDPPIEAVASNEPLDNGQVVIDIVIADGEKETDNSPKDGSVVV